MKRIKDPVSGHVLIRFTTRQGDQQRQRQEQGGKGKATPSDADRGTVTFSISTDNGEMVFSTSYRFLHLPHRRATPKPDHRWRGGCDVISLRWNRSER